MSTSNTRVIMNPAALAELLRGPTGPVYRRMIEDGDLVKAEARRLCGVHVPDPWGRPKNRKPGALRDSINKRVVSSSAGVTVEVGTDDPVGLFQEQGTPPHIIVPKGKTPLLFFLKGDSEVTAAMVVHHPGTPAKHWLTKALDVLRARY